VAKRTSTPIGNDVRLPHGQRSRAILIGTGQATDPDLTELPPVVNDLALPRTRLRGSAAELDRRKRLRAR
jgi:hypothetical protein